MLYTLVIVGAGPTGIEAALQAHRLGLSYVLLEKDDVGALIEQTMNQKKFYRVYGRNTTSVKGDLAFPDRIKGAELVALWKEQARALATVRAVTVRSIVNDGQHFVIATSGGEYQAQRVLLTSGTFESEKRLHVEGEAGNPKFFYRFDYYNDYQGKTIVIIGGGNSAVETAIECSDDNDVTMVVRRDDFAATLAENNRAAIHERMNAGRVKVLSGAVVERIGTDELSAFVGGVSRTLPYDVCFVHIGFEKPTDFLEQCGIECRDGAPALNDQFETNVHGLFVAGSLTGADSIVECANQAYDIVHAIADSA